MMRRERGRAASRRAFLERAGCVGVGFALGTRWGFAMSQNPPDANYDEAKVPHYTLPDPLVMADGERVRDTDQWGARRNELLHLFAREVYGETPQTRTPMRFEVFEESKDALDGKAQRVQMSLFFGEGDAALRAELLVYLPREARAPVPAFLGLNFEGNHAVSVDPAVRVNTGWFRDQPRGSHPDNKASERNRGSEAGRWSIARVIERGYAVATMYYGDFDPDYDDGFQNGIHPLLDPPGSAEPNRPADAWGSIGGWAWGLSRGLDALATLPGVDAARVAVMGHSRLGKTALWAGAQDERFALVISNNSGCGGAALSRRAFGETVGRINRSFPHWFCDNFWKYNENEAALPVDQHELIALIAPRPVLVCSAQADLWADPKGEFLACVGADPVYRLLETDGLANREMPGLSSPVLSRIGYHIRPGPHDVKPEDWEVFLDFADRQLAPRQG